MENSQRSLSIFGAGIVLAFSLVSISSANAQYIEWDVEHAVAAGSGCNAQGPFPDTWFVAAGDEVSVIFSRMGVDLTPATAENTAVHSCLVRIPVTVNQSVAIAELSQTLEWGWSKDRDTEAEVHASATFFGRPTTRIDRYLAMNVEGVEAFRTDEVINTYFQPCRNRPRAGNYSLNLAIAGRRTRPDLDISVGIFGEDVKVDVAATWVSC